MLKRLEGKLLLIGLLLHWSCRDIVKNVSIPPEPVFSELDTFQTSKGNIQYNRDDYFLVKGTTNNKQRLHQYIDSFIRKNVGKYCDKYGNYTMLFYRESTTVNAKEINAMDRQYRYKIFLYTQDEDYIASYQCWSSFPAEKVDYKGHYK